jgi:hypothetical protein
LARAGFLLKLVGTDDRLTSCAKRDQITGDT